MLHWRAVSGTSLREPLLRYSEPLAQPVGRRDVSEAFMTESAYRPREDRKGISLCLSGGGFRAALFHLGAVRRLNEVGLLSKVDTFSSVSGGSIASGLL